ncbi:MAG: phosphomannose isomerase type II C-terminal cupin domain [Alphaproteobacteria bacterium]|nr:phosphomannose isomerase type II C-terminal cupin domain [Alphaproteobacteria bacterium]
MQNNYSLGERCERPWGTWAVIDKGQGFIVKRFEVNPGQRLSLQYHNHRQEVWAVASGVGEVQVGNDTRTVGSGDTIMIPMKSLHRITNIGKEVLTIVETQIGDNLDEADIVRLEDDYARAEAK